MRALVRLNMVAAGLALLLPALVFGDVYPIAPPGATVTVQGTAPPGASIYVFVAGVLQPNMPIQADPVTGNWLYQYFATQTAEVTVSFGTQYPPTGCEVSPEQAEINRRALEEARLRGLARTGASHVGTNVLVAILMVTVGLVLVVAMRRRDTLGQRKS